MLNLDDFRILRGEESCMGVKSGEISTKALTSRYLSSTPRAAFRLFALLTTTAMAWAWWVSGNRYLQAESGVGYALGIVGGSLMLILLLYPLRKRMRLMRDWLNLKTWFQLHMLLGVLGPLCILLHSNFRLGSTNSTVALVCMLLVAGSGLVGRYLYGKFHFGLYGQQVGLLQIKTDLDSFYQQLEMSSLESQEKQQLEELYQGCGKIIDSQRQAVSLRQLIRQRSWLRSMSQQVRAGATVASRENQMLVEQQRALSALLDKLAGLRLFERLFGLWHVAHIPVFILMLITAIVHVFVVHWY